MDLYTCGDGHDYFEELVWFYFPPFNKIGWEVVITAALSELINYCD